MNAYTVAAQLLGELELSTGQLSQLRTIDMSYQQRLFTLLHQAGGADAGGPAHRPAAPAREPTAEELEALRAMIVSDLLAMLTPEQRDELPGR